MRLTVTLYKQSLPWMLKNKWLAKGKFYRYPISPPAPLLAKGVKVIDALEAYPRPVLGPLEEFETPNHPLFDPDPKPEDHIDYHADHIYDYTGDSRISQGEKGVCNLTKTQCFYGLPDRVNELIGRVQIPDQDLLVMRYIKQATVWNTTKDKLEHRINLDLPIWKFKREFGISYHKTAHILLSNLVRLTQTLGGDYPDLLWDRTVHPEIFIRAKYNYQGKPIQIHDALEFFVTSHRPLSAFASEDVVDASTQHELPDLYPILPTIDLEKTHFYKDSNYNGFRGKTTWRHPHTLFMRTESWPTHEQNAKLHMFLFGTAALAARQRFGADVRILPKPVCVQAVATDGVVFQFACFQLNTLDLSSDNGIKNLIWYDNDNSMYQRIVPKRSMLRNTEYCDYDPAVMSKILAFYINGADLSLREWPHLVDKSDDISVNVNSESIRQ